MVKVAASTVSSPVLVRVAGPSAAIDVAHVEQLEDLEALLADLVLLHPDLDLAGAVADLEEGGLAEAAHREHPAGHRPVARVAGDLLGGRVAVAGVEVAGQVAPARGRCRTGSRRAARSCLGLLRAAARRSRARWLPAPRTSTSLVPLDRTLDPCRAGAG